MTQRLMWWVVNFDTILGVLVCGMPVVLILAAVWTHIIDIHPRGVWIHGQFYRDEWRDD